MTSITAREHTAYAAQYVGQACTLNGRPAKIVGAKLLWPHVVTLDGALDYEWSWVSVALVMERGGDFRV